MLIFNSLAPVFLVIVLGGLLRWSNFISENILDGLTRLAYWVGLPALLFYKIAGAHFRGGGIARAFVVLMIGTGSSLVLAYLIARLLHLPKKSHGTFVQAAFRSNLAFVGLPVVLYTLTNLGGSNVGQVETMAVLLLAPMVLVYNVVSVLVLLMSQHKREWSAVRKMARLLGTNPLILASAVGLLFSLLNLKLPQALFQTLTAIGQMAIPLALICIGGALASIQVQGNVLFALVAAVLKTGFAPAIGYFVARALGVGAEETRIVLIYLACPTAAASYVLADQIGGDSALAASSVFASTILALVSLAVVVAVRL